MKQSPVPMQSKGHRPGCRCALCLEESDPRQAAGTQLYALLNMSWFGVRAATGDAESARKGIEEAFPNQARLALGYLRTNNRTLLDNLLADNLD